MATATRKTRILVALVLFAGGIVMSAAAGDAPVLDWQKVLGGDNADWGVSIRQISDGGYVIAG
jgi:predicted CDP-diglyceride synthetase/phosphatidate cytidylyltransferase